MQHQSAYNNNKRVTTLQLAFSVAYLLSLLMLLTINTPMAEARPMDLYDDVGDFFDAVSLDDVPLSGRSAPETFCRMPIRKGVCRALIPRFSYDPSRKTCVEFKFGGCDGNENNFSSYEACMATCEGM
ncbi:kunitz-type serine protease inhibitor homolog beta-bungarotoxin B chain [Anastrepha obliqua]|uniref:kunitz-type serine protease inhibitor homolog beta-bungarotoxin B chain n=1 Tax=Anastrepha obliqua TaxID=95512 RepID=UPI0024095219|nr:kunitz-type serine protease inhibitor homolog beta-bungarotoxin B chain [Anastrepha obliqua]